MKLFQISISPIGIRVWRGRLNGYSIFIKEIMNEEMGYVDRYSYIIKNKSMSCCIDSLETGKTFSTVDVCKDAAISAIMEYQSCVKSANDLI